MSKTFLITGGAGFIGSAVARHLISATPHQVVVVDKLTYAGNLENLESVAHDPRFAFEQTDVCDEVAMKALLAARRPDVLMHLAAESHVDRSIEKPGEFLRTNIMGTFALLEAATEYWRGLEDSARESFRFHHVSTDEVYGSLGSDGLFHEATPYAPSSPYAASKAASDHLARAWRHTFGLPTIVSNSSNNYGPYQFPEKLIPLTIINALVGKALPVYGRGDNVRDWLHVEDHARALLLIAERGSPGETYNVGSNSERSNISVVREICALVDEFSPNARLGAREKLIRFVADRPGHDLRYAISAKKIVHDLGWRPQESFEAGLRKTVAWYVENRQWWSRLGDDFCYGERLGVFV